MNIYIKTQNDHKDIKQPQTEAKPSQNYQIEPLKNHKITTKRSGAFCLYGTQQKKGVTKSLIQTCGTTQINNNIYNYLNTYMW